MDGTTVTCYVDGVLFGSQVAGATLNVPATHSVYLSQPPGGAAQARAFVGDFGPVAIYDKTLAASDIANLFNQGSGGAAGAGGVATVTAADGSAVTGGTATNVTVATGSLDAIATAHPPLANWSNNSHKITALTAGAAAGEAAIWDQTPPGIVTAKGDVIGGTGSHAASNLAVGTNGQVLTADSTQATGLKWATAPSGASPLTTKGDLYGFDSANNRIPVGSNGQILTADSTQTLGLKWSAAAYAGSGTQWGNLVVPIGNPAIIVASQTASPSANQAWGVRVVIPVTGTLHDIAVYVSTNSGTVDVGVYDTAATTRTRLYHSGTVTPGGTGWRIIGDPALAVSVNDEYDIVACFSSASFVFVRLAGTNALQYTLPTNFLAGAGGTPLVGWSFAVGAATLPSTIAEASMSAQAPIGMIARVS
jgi:hypothetical protein